jgi:DNA-binding transcriptional ArsR family regulator
MRDVRAAVPLFAALGDATRMQIVGRLSLGERLSIATLTAGTGVTRQAVTKHLRVLDEVGLVRSRRRGRERVWELEPARLDAARRSLDLIAAQWTTALGRLKTLVERPVD